MITDAAYWIAIAHLPRWRVTRINHLIVEFHRNLKITIEEFFNLPTESWESHYGLNFKEVQDLENVKKELPNYAFLAEDMGNQGYELIPLKSRNYSRTLGSNLGRDYSPPLLYIKGNAKILHENSIAIVGSRTASDIALDFADNIARLASKEYKVVVSGFAKGVDKQALDSALKYKGQSIIVLPQGILTFTSGFKKYYKQIVQGDVLALSTFFPKAPWKAELAMARNRTIYGLAKDIYVAESSNSGGTWSGVIDGLRKKRIIYVRKPEGGEKNANAILISKGAVPVDIEGTTIEKDPTYAEEEETIHPNIGEPAGASSDQNTDEVIRDLLRGKPLTVKEIIIRSGLNWNPGKMSRYINKIDGIRITKSGRSNAYFLIKQKTETSNQVKLFD